MINKFASLLILFFCSVTAFAQENQPIKKRGRPDIPGTFVVELGLNRAQQAPSDFKIGLWGSRTINFYYQYDIRILKSRFSFVPGIGLSLERYKFKNNNILSYANNTTDSVVLMTPTQAGITGVKRSQLITNYIEIPIEIKYSSKPDDPARSFKASIGGRIGYLYDSFTKVKYKENGEKKVYKDKQNFNLNSFRYGLYGKVGIGNFSVFTYYNISPLFKTGKGFRSNTAAGFNDFNTITVGISLASF
jgi:hypothetical protein